MQITTLASGSTGNCSLICQGNTRILLDAGISCKRIREGLLQENVRPGELDAVFITHEHSDHISGLRVLEKNFPVPVYTTLPVIHMLEKTYPELKIPFHEIETGNPFSLGEISVTAFHVPHDAADCVGFRFAGDAVLGYATDCGCITEEVVQGLAGADIAMIEANHDITMLREGMYPYYLKRRILSDRGHLSNESCAELAGILLRQGTRSFILGHLSRNNNTVSAALGTVSAALPDVNVQLQAAPMAGNLTVSAEVI